VVTKLSHKRGITFFTVPFPLVSCIATLDFQVTMLISSLVVMTRIILKVALVNCTL